MESSRDIATLVVLFVSLYFEVFMLITYIEHRKTLKGRLSKPIADYSALPAVTIIVPCFNEEKTAGKTIESLLALDYPQDKLKIVAVNDGSSDGTAALLETYKITYPQIEIIHKENGGKHTALNLAIERATTPFVGCLDADSYAEKDALTRIMKRFEQSEVMAVVPSLHIYNPRSIIQRLQKVEYILGVFLRSTLAELNALYVTPGPFSIFRKSVFETIGYYKKAHNTEDMEMALRMQSNGMKIANAHDAVVYTSSPKTIPKLYKQRVRWTSGFLHNVRDYRSMIFKPQFGHIGGFVLPFMLISTAAVIFVVTTLIYDFINSTSSFITRLDAIGMRAFEWSWPTFDWFYMRTSPIMFGGIVALLTIFTIIYLGSRLSKGNRPKITDIACYTVLYSIIAPFWIIRSVANVALSKQASWR
jgi:cellulose synthase/poly-beta-1,6-N-acetylglucosamine synthase-like glycosyltransferase